MQLARVIGTATSTIKHPSMNGWRLVVLQMLSPNRSPDGETVLAVDSLGSSPGQAVILNSDGKAAREMIGNDKSPVRWFVIGLLDE